MNRGRGARGATRLPLAGALATLLVVAGCTAGADVLVEADQPAAMVALADGGLLVGERLSGRIVRVSAGGDTTPVAVVEVRTDGEQRGLLGLAVDPSDRIFAAFTRPGDGAIVVAQVAPERRDVWVGPASVDLANGGHIAFGPDGRLVIGIGSLTDETLIEEPGVPNGKLLTLDPDGDPGQEPVVLASGFHNPFAFVVAPDGDIYVGDNSPGDEPERLLEVRAPLVTEPQPPPGTPTMPEPTLLASIDAHTVASGLALLPGGRLAMCTYLGRTLQLWQLDEISASAVGEPLASDCLLGVVTLADGRLAYATGDDVRVVAGAASTSAN